MKIVILHKYSDFLHLVTCLAPCIESDVADPSAKREGLVTAVLYTCTVLPKTGVSNQIAVLKHDVYFHFYQKWFHFIRKRFW